MKTFTHPWGGYEVKDDGIKQKELHMSLDLNVYRTITKAVPQAGVPLASVANEVAVAMQDNVTAYSPKAASQMLARIEDGVHAAPPAGEGPKIPKYKWKRYWMDYWEKHGEPVKAADIRIEIIRDLIKRAKAATNPHDKLAFIKEASLACSNASPTLVANREYGKAIEVYKVLLDGALANEAFLDDNNMRFATNDMRRAATDAVIAIYDSWVKELDANPTSVSAQEKNIASAELLIEQFQFREKYIKNLEPDRENIEEFEIREKLLDQAIVLYLLAWREPDGKAGSNGLARTYAMAFENEATKAECYPRGSQEKYDNALLKMDSYLLYVEQRSGFNAARTVRRLNVWKTWLSETALSPTHNEASISHAALIIDTCIEGLEDLSKKGTLEDPMTYLDLADIFLKSKLFDQTLLYADKFLSARAGVKPETDAGKKIVGEQKGYAYSLKMRAAIGLKKEIGEIKGYMEQASRAFNTADQRGGTSGRTEQVRKWYIEELAARGLFEEASHESYRFGVEAGSPTAKSWFYGRAAMASPKAGKRFDYTVPILRLVYALAKEANIGGVIETTEQTAEAFRAKGDLASAINVYRLALKEVNLDTASENRRFLYEIGRREIVVLNEAGRFKEAFDLYGETARELLEYPPFNVRLVTNPAPEAVAFREEQKRAVMGMLREGARLEAEGKSYEALALYYRINLFDDKWREQLSGDSRHVKMARLALKRGVYLTAVLRNTPPQEGLSSEESVRIRMMRYFEAHPTAEIMRDVYKTLVETDERFRTISNIDRSNILMAIWKEYIEMHRRTKQYNTSVADWLATKEGKGFLDSIFDKRLEIGMDTIRDMTQLPEDEIDRELIEVFRPGAKK